MTSQLLALCYWLALRLRDGWVFVRRPRSLGVRVLVTRQGAQGREVLLVRHRVGRTPWELPGGGVGYRESVAAAARREVLEEAGTPIQVEGLHGVFDNFQLWRSDTVLVVLGTPTGEPQPTHSFEIAEAAFVAIDRLPPRLGPGSRRCIRAWTRGDYGLLGDWNETT